MPLVLRLNPAEKIIINGVVIENTGGLAMLAIRNRGNILRQKDILQLDEAATPALRVYYTLQCLYLFPDEIKAYSEALHQFMNDFEAAAPGSKPIIDAARAGREGRALSRPQGRQAPDQVRMGFARHDDREGQNAAARLRRQSQAARDDGWRRGRVTDLR